MFSRALAILLAIVSAVALFFGLRSKQLKVEAEADKQRADAAEAVNDAHRLTDDALRTTEERHRTEQFDSEKRLAEGKRDHLEEHW